MYNKPDDEIADPWATSPANAWGDVTSPWATNTGLTDAAPGHETAADSALAAGSGAGSATSPDGGAASSPAVAPALSNAPPSDGRTDHDAESLPNTLVGAGPSPAAAGGSKPAFDPLLHSSTPLGGSTRPMNEAGQLSDPLATPADSLPFSALSFASPLHTELSVPALQSLTLDDDNPFEQEASRRSSLRDVQHTLASHSSPPLYATSATRISPLTSVVDVDPLGALGAPPVSRTPSPAKKPLATDAKSPDGEKCQHEFSVAVLEPLKVGDSLSGHVEYRVTTKTSHPGYRNKECSVMRRFSDFYWLYGQLVGSWSYCGLVVPLVPEKQAVGRFHEDFIKARQKGLDTFLKRLVAHPVLQQSQHLQFFLEADAFAQDKKNWDTASSAKNGIWGGAEPPRGDSLQFAVPMDGCKELAVRRDALLELEKELKGLSVVLEGIVKQREELASQLSDMGDAFATLSRPHITLDSLHEKLHKVAAIHKEISAVSMRQKDLDVQAILSRVEEYQIMIASVKIAYLARSRLYDRICQAETTLTKKEAELAKQSSQKVRTDKINDISSQISQARLVVEDLSVEFQKATTRLIGECARIQTIQTTEFREGTREFCLGMLALQKEASGMSVLS
ncbi:Vacuolar protein sorting-associated protein 5 [Kappamyces sp. JEL0829]|nr:Vacuolar protein sorting-associated protein 5 [Kappamyces sp. JEL0829]KAJ3304133.1 Vacuolar protein sorting-associated protein 5 [Kappamyces sp. JEL0829]